VAPALFMILSDLFEMVFWLTCAQIDEWPNCTQPQIVAISVTVNAAHTHTAPTLTQAHSQDEPTHVQLARRKHVAMCRHVFMLQQAEKSLFACQQGGQPKQNPNQNQKQRRKAGFSRGIHIHVGRSQAPLRLQELVGAFQEVVLASRVPLRHWPGAFHAGVAGI